MCTTHDSRPPIEPISGAAADALAVTLESADGTEFRAFLARPEQATGAGILILPDVRGLHPFFEELALRYAERGILALAIDYFGRTAGTAERGPDFDHSPHVKQLRWEQLQDDIRAGAAFVRTQEPAPRSVFTTGFCMGGRLATVSTTLGLGLAGAIPFYGWPVGDNASGAPAPVDVAGAIESDILAFYGEADQGIPKEARDAFDAALAKAGVRHETVVYPGATHSFFDRRATEFADAAEDAWNRALAFIRRHTAGQPIASPMGAPAAAATDGEPSDPRIAHWTGDD